MTISKRYHTKTCHIFKKYSTCHGPVLHSLVSIKDMLNLSKIEVENPYFCK